MGDDSRALLRTYLQDHHAGSTAGLELARRAAGSNAEGEDAAQLAAIADEIDEDRQALERIMQELEIKPHPVKDGAAWTAEKLGRLKPNNRLLSYSPLSRVIELEGLVIAVTAKRGLWVALIDALGERIGEVDLAILEQRALDQRERLQQLHRAAAREAFAAVSI
jgi:hypothetical protein